MGSTLGDKYDLILALRSQIFEYLHECFYRHALRVPAIGLFRKKKKRKKKTVFLRKRLTIIDLLKACGRWGHVFATTSASPTGVGPKQKNWLRMSTPPTAAHGGQHDTTSNRVTFEQLLKAAFVGEITSVVT